MGQKCILLPMIDLNRIRALRRSEIKTVELSGLLKLKAVKMVREAIGTG